VSDNKEIELIFPDPEPEEDVPTFQQQEQTWGDKLVGSKDNYKYETIAYMAASGMKHIDIAKQIGMTPGWVGTVLSNTYVKGRVKEIQAKVLGGSIEERFKNAMPQAMKVMEETIKDESAASQELKVNTSKWVLEKVTGKATQTVSHEGNLLKDFIGKLDSVTSGEREVDEIIELQADADPMDDWIRDNVPTHTGVGTKDKGDSDDKKE